MISQLKGQLIVSCQARPGNPLAKPEILAALAKAAEMGGAAGIRANAPENIAAIRQATALPIVGLYKQDGPHSEIITPDWSAAKAIVQAGAHIVAISCAFYQRANLNELAQLIQRIRYELNTPVMADVSTLEEGLWAAEAGANLLATTLSGYTPATRSGAQEPDVALVAALSGSTQVPVVAEGRIWTPGQLAQVFAAGAYAAVVGTAITNPMAITQRFVEALP